MRRANHRGTEAQREDQNRERRIQWSSSLRFLFSLCLCASVVSSSFAAAPSITHLFPAGAQRGTTTEITAFGTTDKTTKMWASGKGLSVEPGKDSGKFAVKVGADAVPGTYWLRAFNNDGASSLRPFIVGMLPEIMEKEPNDDPKKAQMLDGPAIVNGQLAKPGDVDCFAIAAKKGQTLVASLEANRTLKSPMDGVLQIVSTDGFVLEHNNDYHGLDPQIAYVVPKDGMYIVRVFAFPSAPDTSIRFAGAESYVYRLTVTTGGFLDYTMPLAIGPNAKTVEARGWNITDETRTLPISMTAVDESKLTVFHPKLANPFRTRFDKHATVPGADVLPVPPICTSLAISQPGEEASLRFTGKKGQPLSIQVESRSFGLPLDPVIRILDNDKKQLARAEPAKLAGDTALSFAPPADGTYTITVGDLYGAGGSRHAFLLRVMLPEPDYDLSVVADRFAIPPGKALEIPVKINRKNGFAKPVEIAAEGLPAGVKLEVKPAAKADPNSVTIALSAEKAGISGAFRLVGKVKDEPAFTRTARALLPEFEDSTADLWLAVTDSPMPPVPPKKK